MGKTSEVAVGDSAPDPAVMSSGLQLVLKAKPDSSSTNEDALKWREEALSLREQLLQRREQDLDAREADLTLRESRLRAESSGGVTLRKLPCQNCSVQGRMCGRLEPCYDAQGYQLHHHHNCQACHDARKAQRRARRHGQSF